MDMNNDRIIPASELIINADGSAFHIHLTPEYAEKNGIKDGDMVDVLVESIKPTKFFDVQVRVRDDFNTEMHIDTDDANSAGIKNGDKVIILKK